MSPPTEQLIRDYLNRLSVAARGRLGSEDRQALVMRTRDFIERNASEIRAANPMQIAALLSGLGDPGALVDQEVARLAAARGETVTAPAARNGRLAGALRRRSGTASWHWPRAAGSPHLQTQLLNGGAPEPAEDAGTPLASVPEQRAAGDLLTAVHPAESTPVSDQPDDGSFGRPVWPSAVISRPVASSGPAGAATAAETPPRQPPAIAGLARTLLGRARAHPLEAVAATVLGLGGAAYPPVWLLGAVVALASRVWDYRDKWVGLAGPVLLLVVGTVAGVSLGHRHAALRSYVHEGWIYIDVLSRVGALLGAGYLVWRVSHARSAPQAPPWNRPHRVN